MDFVKNKIKKIKKKSTGAAMNKKGETAELLQNHSFAETELTGTIPPANCGRNPVLWRVFIVLRGRWSAHYRWLLVIGNPGENSASEHFLLFLWRNENRNP